MAFKTVIDGTDRTEYVTGCTIEKPHGERATATLELAPGFVPDKRDAVTLYEQDGVTPKFGGVVFARDTRGVHQLMPVEVEVVDYSVYGDWRDVTVNYIVDGEPSPSVTLKTVLTVVVAAIAGFGVTLDAGQLDGPDLSAFEWDHVLVTDAIRELREKTGWVDQWSATKVLSMVAPGLTSAPTNITDDNAQVEWADSLDKYGTRVNLLCGPDGAGETFQEWDGDGVTESWVTDRRATAPDPTYVLESVAAPPSATFRTVTTRTVFTVSSSSVANPTVITTSRAHNFSPGDTVKIAGHAGSTPAINGTHEVLATPSETTFTINVNVTVGGTGGTVVESRADYRWVRSTHRLYLDQAAVPAVGTTIRLDYTGIFPFLVQKDAGINPAIICRRRAQGVVTTDAANELATALLAQIYQDLKTIQVVTITAGYEPGQAVAVVSAYRNLDHTGLITRVTTNLISGTYWQYTLEVIGVPSGTPVYQGSYLDIFRQMASGGGSSVPTISGAGGGGTTVVNLTSPFPLGGARVSSVPMGTPPAWTPALNWHPYRAPSSFSVRVRVSLWARDAGVGVTGRLYDVTAAAAAATSSEVTSTTATEVLFTAALAAGHVYRLEVISDTAEKSAYAIGTLETL